jgi:hypothetical protein
LRAIVYINDGTIGANTKIIQIDRVQ